MVNKSLKRNYIYNLFQQILTLITPLITAPYIARVIGAEGIGAFSYTSSIVSYFTLFASLGIYAYASREISYNQDNRKQRSVIFWNVKILSLITTCLCLVFYLIFIYFSDQKYRIIYFIQIFSLISIIADTTFLFSGMEEFGITVMRNIICRILNVLLIFIFVHQKEDLYTYIFLLSLTTFICNISLWSFVPKFIDKPKFKEIHPFTSFNIIFSLFFPTIAISIYTVLDKTMLGILTSGTLENGYYEQALKLSKVVLVLVTSLGTVMVPRIGYHFERKEISQIQEFMYRSYRFVWFLGIPLCLGLIGVSPNFIPWFYGDEFNKVIPLLSILSFLILAIGINNVTGVQYLIPTKRQNVFTITVIIGAMINFIGNLILIPKFKSIGAAISSVVAETIIATIQIIIVRKELKPQKILSSSFNYICAGIIMYVILLMENHFMRSSVINTLIMIASGTIIYFMILFMRKDTFFISTILSFKEKILKKVTKKRL